MRNLVRFFGTITAGCFTLLVVLLTIQMAKSMWVVPAQDARSPHVAVIDLNGTILSSSAFTKRMDELLEQPGVKAIVVRINSPGGLVGPSQEIYESIRKADAKVPVIASMGSVAASGGYYAAIGARKIYANAGTLTASIGVIMEFANTQKLFEWAKIQRFTITAGKLKDVGSPLRPMTPEERTFLTNLLAEIHKHFRLAVKERRNLSDAELGNTADGRIMTGSQAVQAKLADHIGSFSDAVKDAKKLAGLPETAKVDLPEKHKGALRELLLGEDDPEGSFGESLKHLADSLAFSYSKPGWRILLIAQGY